MKLEQQIIESEITKIEKKLNTTKDLAFLRFTHSLITGIQLHEFDKNDIVDGGQDKQIDTITIEEEDDGAIVYILQSKFVNSFSSNSLIQMGNGLDWIFNKSKKELNKLPNIPLVDKINEYRSVQSNIGTSNLTIKVFFITNGENNSISDEFKHELEALRNKYSNGIFNEFVIEAIGCESLVWLLKKYEEKSKKIDVDLRMVYDANNPSLIKYHSENLKGIIASIPATEIARIVNDDPYGFIFDLNIRRYLGKTGQVNSEIKETATGSVSNQFWYLNNGITIICDSVDPITDPDNPKIKIKNIQIVNGCQTATTIAEASKNGQLKNDVKVLTRIYQTNDKDLVNKIVRSTNNQNKISGRNLKSNDEIQKDLARRFTQLGYYYERNSTEFSKDNHPIEKIVSNEILAQAYLAIVLKKPSDSMGRKYKIWSDHYKNIFQNKIIDPFITSFTIYKATEDFIENNSQLKNDSSSIKRKIAKNGVFHLSRIASFLYKKNDNWNEQSKKLETDLTDIKNNLKKVIPDGIILLKEIIESEVKFKENVDSALKSYDLDDAINKKLYSLKLK